MTETLTVLLEQYQADRAYIFRFNEQEQNSSLVCEMTKVENRQINKSHRIIPNKYISEAFQNFKNGAAYILNTPDEIAGKVPIEVFWLFMQYGIQSCLSFPIQITGKLWGYVGVDTVTKIRKWYPVDIDYIRAVSNILAVTIASNFKVDIINTFNKISGRQRLQIENKFDNILDALPVPVILYTNKGDYLGCNNALLKLFGYKSRTEVNKTNLFIYSSIFPEQIKQTPYQMDMAYNVINKKLYKNIAEVPYSPELKYLSAQLSDLDQNGHNTAEKIASAIDHKNNNGYLLLINEVSDHILKKEEPAPGSTRSRSSFMANIGHEFITPLNAIIGFSELISLSESQTERNMFYNVIESNKIQLINLIEDLAEYSRIESGKIMLKIQKVNISSILTKLSTTLNKQYGENIQIDYQPNQNEQAYTHSSEESIYKIFFNILNNLIKNMERGVISITHNTSEVDEYGEMLIFSIKTPDLIIGADKISSIFKKYTKLSEDAMGLDIGLVIAKSLVEHLQGSISVTSKEQCGTEFIIALPVHSKENDNQNEKTAIDTEPNYSNTMSKEIGNNADNNIKTQNTMEEKRLDILLAEDIDFNYMLVNAIIGKQHNLTRAKTGKEAVELFKKNKYNLILMDIKMPEMDGITATKLIRQIDTEIPIIAVSAYAFDADKDVALEAGCNSYIVKPIDSKMLNKAIEEAAAMDYNKGK